MSVADAMSRWVVAVRSGDSIREAAKAMHEAGVGSVMVLDEAGRLVGVFTERDLVRAVAEGAPLDAPVDEYMTREVASVRPGTPILEAGDLMIRLGVRHLPVLDDDGRLVGVISLRDVCQRLLGEPSGD
ncbi:MAG: CBS domain-containing protein [Desulfurococcales archaeon]|nr:CBS domain-containing protein [Desulfurococcales archaeon]